MKCAYCGKEFEQTTYNKKFCSTLCGVRFRHNYPLGGYVKTCAYCGKEFTARRRTKKFCSTLCGQRFRRNKPLEDYVKTCKHCGKEFTAHNGQRQYCSVTCRRAAEKKLDRIYHRKCKREQIHAIPTVPIVASKFTHPPLPPPPPKITIPAAVAENRKPTADELLDWIFSKGAKA